MRVCVSAVLVVSLMLAGAMAPVAAQSLAEVARREAERRKTVKEDGRVLTNKDVPEVHRADPIPAVPVEPSDVAIADKADQPDKAPSDDLVPAVEKGPKDDNQAKDQKAWSDRAKGLQLQLERDQGYAQAMQSRVDGLTTEFVNRDDPAQQAVIANDRQKALAELTRLTTAVDADKKAIVDLEEEARHANVPPGWLR